MSKKPIKFVLDCSITMTWCFEDESTEYTDSILNHFHNSSAIVPTIWPLEVANVLLIAKKNNRISQIKCTGFIEDLSNLPIVIDSSTSNKALFSIFSLAEDQKLTIYDAAYLELALRQKLPLLTLDKELLKAAKKLNISHTLR